jgi:hypothetical protein
MNSHKVDPLSRELARMQMVEEGRKVREAQEAARKKPPGKVNIPKGTPDSVAKQMMFAAGFSSPEPDPTTSKVDHDAPTREKFAAGFSGDGGKEEPTILEKLMAYGERQAAQNTPMPPEQPPAAVVEPSPQARRAEATTTPQGQQQAAEQLSLPTTSAALFEDLTRKVESITTDPAMPVEIRLRQAFRNLPGDQREALVAQIEQQDFGFPGYLGKYQEAYALTLVSDALTRRFADLKRLQPDVTPDDLLQQMVAAAGQG